MPHALLKPVATTAAALIASGIASTGFVGGGPVYAEDASSGTAGADPLPITQIHRLAGERRLTLVALEHQAARARLARIREAKARASRAEARAAARARAAVRARAARTQSRAPRAEVPSGDPRSIARALMGRYGFSAEQFGCLDALWVKESGWNHRATNPSSGAYGIPQSLPATKMASAGSDWRTNPTTQIRWGLNYIKERYGSPCSAWAHSQRTNWY